jgi:threonine aldolase
MIVDFRSDTVTQPTPEMLSAMMQAKVGDDVYGEDTTVNRLEQFAASLFGMEAAVFCPSGTMTNQIGIKIHTQPGDEVICESTAHIYQYEGGGIAANSGAQVHLLQGNHGKVTADMVAGAINPVNDVHKALTTLVSIENTANRGGGSCYDLNTLTAIKEVCTAHNIAYHLDGARLFNAIVQTKTTAKDYGQIFDTISICLSKGLGAPVGSLLLGTHQHIAKARRIRKVFGGGMRQAGFLAAAGLYALKNNIERLQQDHDHAQSIAATLNELPYIHSYLPVETNIVIARINQQYTAAELVSTLREKGILLNTVGKDAVRFVTHLDVDTRQIDYTIEQLRRL